MRILILIAIGLLLYVIISNFLRKKRSSSLIESEKMVQCKHCGLHILEQEAIQVSDEYYCSTEHVEIHRQTK